MKNKKVLIIVISLLFVGCARGLKVSDDKVNILNKSEDESIMDAATALGSVAGSLAGKELTQEELNKITKELENDQEVRSAVESIADAMGGAKVQVKYCPKTGKRYNPDMKMCPVHKIPLEWVE